MADMNDDRYKGERKRNAGRAVPFPGKAQMSEFIIPAQDMFGHSADVHYRVPPGYLREVSELMMVKHLFGWGTAADFHRWALRQGLNRAATFAKEQGHPRLSSLGEQTRAIEEAMAEELMQTRFVEQIGRLEKLVATLETGGDGARITKLVMKIREHAKAMDDEYWKKKWLKEIETRFGRWLRPVSLQDFEEE